MKEERFTNQQGDVLLFKVGALPTKLKKAKPSNRGWILAEGEATGHAHAIADLKNCDVFCDENGDLYLQVKEAVELSHEEHGAQTIEPGAYRVGRVREVDPFSKEIRNVRD